MTQEIIATSIVLLTMLFVLWRLYVNFFGKNKSKNAGCNTCPSAVNCKVKDLKINVDKKKDECIEPDRL